MHRLSAYVIVHRSQSNQTPNAIRSDGERNHQGVQLSQLHQQSQQNNLFKLSPLGFAACQSKNCTNQAIKPTILM